MKQLILMFMSFILFASPSAESAQSFGNCLLGLRNALVNGGFTGPLICERRDYTFVRVGSFQGGQLLIYDYRFRFRPEFGSSLHGGQRIIIFDRGQYLGQFALTPPPYSVINSVDSGIIINDSERRRRYYLDLSHGIPKHAYINDERVVFFR